VKKGEGGRRQERTGVGRGRTMIVCACVRACVDIVCVREVVQGLDGNRGLCVSEGRRKKIEM
jgi:hypothetical protein